jgi:3-deoxy-D-manno-octulosonic acid kinase
MNTRSLQIGNNHILYDVELLSECPPELFAPQHFLPDGAVNRLGRGAVYLFQFAGVDMVLRHYQRGGLIRFISHDHYIYNGLEKTRMWQEFHLLQQLYALQLPVPRPIAVRCLRRYACLYQGDLITQTIPFSQTLAQRLQDKKIDAALWQEVGRTISRFHAAGAYHADLNANNIMLDEQNRIYLLDFDRGELRTPNSAWQQQNLQRLKRSLIKLNHLSPTMHFELGDWENLLLGYGWNQRQ